jgi:tRNA modification GTPase
MTHLTDTIAALATPPGEGAIGVVRMSGPEAIAIAAQMYKGADLADKPTHTFLYGRIVEGNEVVDEVVLLLYKAPRSYTGEDTVEISCHGSQYILNRVINLCISHGARLAKPGEFTMRAFLNGKLDLAQAEAVADLIASRSQAAHKTALHQMRGGLSHELMQLREELIQFSALIELELDFSEEDVAFADRSQLSALIEKLTRATERLIDSFSLGNAIKNGIGVAITGAPNAGKSTLLNALLNEERAIVSEIAGTTRDTIEETLNIKGILFRLIDTAGIREHAADSIEKIGMERSQQAIDKADIVIYLFDLMTEPAEAVLARIAHLQQGSARLLAVANKTDEPAAAQRKEALHGISGIIYLSARNRDNIDALKEALYETATHGKQLTEGAIVTSARHHEALKEMLRSLNDIKTGMDAPIPADLIALDIRRCLHYLGEITGAVTTEDKLDYIFSKFCIGK